MTYLYYEVPKMGGSRIGTSLELGLEHAVRMLTWVIEESGLDPSGFWYCEAKL